MAYSITTETERDNFSRFAQGILGPGTTIARDVLQRHIAPTVLSQKVKNGHSVWYRLNKQQRTLVRNAQSDGYRKFDISLIYYILRNLSDPSKPKYPTPTKGWGRQPQPGDVSISDDIERLRILRNNVLAHRSTASLPESDYQTVWQQLKDIANRMGRDFKKNYLKEMEDLESYKMTDAQWKELFGAIDSVKDNLNEGIENMTKELKDMFMSEAQETRDQIKRLSSHHETFCSESEIENLRDKLLRINESETQTIPVSPLQKSMTLPIDLLYVSVVVRENSDYHTIERRRKLKLVQAEVSKESSKSEPQSSDNDSSDNSSESQDSTSESLCTEEDSEDSCPNLSEDSDSSLTSTSSEDETILSSNVNKRMNVFSDQNDDQPNLNMRHHKIVSGPEEIFNKDGKPVRYVVMLGRAAHGKTVYCLRLLQHWCSAKYKFTTNGLNEWEEVMKTFDFVFFVPLRHVQKSRASVNEMIIQDIFKHDKECQNAIKYVLSSEKFRCLLIIDGLDEWNASKEIMDKLTCKGMPNFEDMSNCTVFMTSRPWKYYEISHMIKSIDRVIEILGLNDNQLKKVVTNVLTNYYGVHEDHDDFKVVYKEIIEKSKDEKMKSFMRIPLLAIAFVQIAYEKKNVRGSLTCFYIALIDLIIKRAFGKDQIPKCFLKQRSEEVHTTSFLHGMIEKTDNMSKFLSILLLLGKVAFDALKPKTGRLVFTTEDLRQTIGQKELQFALHTGLLTRTEAPGSFNEENVKISFFHKTVQEFLAALYLAQNEEKLDLFLGNLSSLQFILDFSYILIFLSGLSPTIARGISKSLPSIIEKDKNVSRWIQKPNQNHWTKVKELFEMQVNCFKEIKYSHSLQLYDSMPLGIIFCFSTVYLDANTNAETMSTIAEALKRASIDISHLCLKGVRNDSRCGINDIVLKKFLTSSTTLKSLTILGENYDRSIHKIKIPSLEILDLSGVKIQNSTTGNDSEETLLALEMFQIRRLKLYGMDLVSRPLGLFFNMTKLESVQLSNVTMSEKSWKGLFYTLSILNQQYNVTIRECNIDAEIHRYISSLHGLAITNKTDEISSESVMEIRKH